MCTLTVGCGLQPQPSREASEAATQPARPEQELVEGLVLASRMLSRPELNIQGGLGHISVRSQVNPNHYYMARYVSAGIVSTSDIVETDLDSNPVDGPRTDLFQEVYLHGEIYKARPDVMAMIHAHPPELIAFSVNSVPLLDGDDPVPVWDIRPVNKGRAGIVSSPELGRSMAQALGSRDAVLLLGHGVAVTAFPLDGVVGNATSLLNAARLQQALIAMGGSWDPNPRRMTAPPEPREARPAAQRPVVPVTERSPGGSGGGIRQWDLLKRLVLEDNGGRVPTVTPPAPERAATANEALRQDVAVASRILASLDVGVLDFAGHVSVAAQAIPTIT